MRPAVRTWFVRAVVAALILAAVGYLAISYVIGRGVRDAVTHAQIRYDIEPVDALLRVVVDESVGLKDRNRAIWALGQIGSSDALPLLQSMHTGDECQHQRQLCQRELRKAIDLCVGALNISAPVWRHGELASR